MTTTTTTTTTETASSQAHIQRPQPRQVSAVLMNTFIDDKFNGDPLSMSKVIGVPTSQIKRWLSKDAVMIGNAVYLRASKFNETKAAATARKAKLELGTKGIPFNHYLDKSHNGRQTHFADTYGIHQQQVNRWTKTNCVFLCGHVYREQRELDFTTNSTSEAVTVH